MGAALLVAKYPYGLLVIPSHVSRILGRSRERIVLTLLAILGPVSNPIIGNETSRLDCTDPLCQRHDVGIVRDGLSVLSHLTRRSVPSARFQAGVLLT
jgi:hypothetical protein